MAQCRKIPDPRNFLGIAWVFPIPLELPETASLRALGIIEGGVALLRGNKEWNIPGNVVQTVIWLPVKGCVTLECNGKKLHISPGKAAIRPTNQPHRVIFETQTFEHVFFRFSSVIFPRVQEVEYSFAVLAAEIIRKMHFDRLRNRSDALFAASSMLAGLISEVTGGQNSRISYDKIQAVIEKEPAAPWSTRMLAKRFHLSDSLLYKLCMAELGKNPSQIIASIKMGQAEALLRCSDAPLDSIALHLGYSSAYAFSKAFYRFCGCRPGVFRRNAQSRCRVDNECL